MSSRRRQPDARRLKDTRHSPSLKPHKKHRKRSDGHRARCSLRSTLLPHSLRRRHPEHIAPPGRVHCPRLKGDLPPFHRGSARTAHSADFQAEFKAENIFVHLILSLNRATLSIQSVFHRASTAASPCVARAVRRACQLGGARAAIGGFKSASAGTAVDAAGDADW